MKIYQVFFITLAVFVVLLFLLPRGFISSDLGNVILTIGTFLFGIIAGFYIIVTSTDYNSIKSILAVETAAWISLHHNVFIYDQKLGGKLSLLIDELMRKAFDYEIIDYARNTHLQFEKINNEVRNLPVRNGLSSLHQTIRGNINDITIARQQLTVLGAKTLSAFQWMVLFVLAIIPIASLYGLRTGELFFDVVTVTVSSVIVLILVLIRDLDLYIWNEKTFSFEIFQNVFRAIGQLPYYPVESVKKKRIHPVEKEYRIGILVDFPKTLERKIEVVKLSG